MMRPALSEAYALSQRARALLDLGRPREALPLLARAAAVEPDNARIHCLLALAHFNAGNYHDCVCCAETAVRVAPDAEWGHRLRANGLLCLGVEDSEQALVSAQEAVRCAPQERRALHTLTRALMEEGRYEDAEFTARGLIALAPETLQAQEAMGLVTLRQKRWPEAEQHFRAALRLHPQSSRLLNNLGVVLQKRGQWLDAMNCYHQAAMLAPNAPTAHRNLMRSARISMFGPAGCAILVLTGVLCLFFGRAAAVPGFVAWVLPLAVILIIALLQGVHAWRRWQALSPATRRVLRLHLGRFCRFPQPPRTL